MSQANENVPVIVQTINLSTGDLESQRVVDHSVRDDRVWMGKHCFWAFRNGREIRTFAASIPTSEGARDLPPPQPLLRIPDMATFDVSDSDLEDGHLTTWEAHDAETAAQRWAGEYCAYHAEYDVSECFVREAGEPWKRYAITIESRPVFYAHHEPI